LRKEFEDSRFSSRFRRQNLQQEKAEWQEKLTRRSALQAVIEAKGLAAAEKLGAQLYDLCQPHFEVYEQMVEIGSYEETPQLKITKFLHSSISTSTSPANWRSRKSSFLQTRCIS
jgi:hypothetical protein